MDQLEQLAQWEQLEFVAGVDEAGRGPLAGAVVAAAVMIPRGMVIEGVADSKKLSEAKRERLAEQIKRECVYSIACAEVEEIDTLNILHATMLAMQRAIQGLQPAPHLVLVDGNRLPDIDYAAHAIVKGDQLVPAISAASILAKVTRDHQLMALDKIYPQYGFSKHKGYPTRAHVEALEKYGVTPVHRKSFAPVRRCMLTP